MGRFVWIITLVLIVSLFGCEKQPAEPPGGAESQTAMPDTPAASPAGGHHGDVVELGSSTISGFDVRASRDQGEIRAGGDVPIDVWVTGGSSRVVAVRFWIGADDARGSVKARAQIEHPEEPEHWHTHVEVPDPLPADSRLWVEIESEDGERRAGSFGLLE